MSHNRSFLMVADLTRIQVRSAPPPVDLANPVSRQYQLELHTYYGWPVWEPRKDKPMTGPLGDTHLRSTCEVAGYHILANDGEIGHVKGLLVDEESWTIENLVVNTKNWLPGKTVLVAPRWIDSVSWSHRRVVINKSREEIKSGELGPTYDPAAAIKRTYGEGA